MTSNVCGWRFSRQMELLVYEFSIFRGLVTLTAFLLGTESTALYLDIVSQIIYKNYNYNKILQFSGSFHVYILTFTSN